VVVELSWPPSGGPPLEVPSYAPGQILVALTRFRGAGRAGESPVLQCAYFDRDSSSLMHRFKKGASMRTLTSGFLAVAALAIVSHPARAQKEKEKESEVQEVIKEFTAKDPGMAAWFHDAWGYAVFPNVGKGGLVVGGAHGNGRVYEQGKLIGKTELTAVTFGLQAGGQSFREVIFFKDQAALGNFTRGNFEFQAGLSAVALKEGVSKSLAYDKGVAVMSAVKGGLMAEASVGGQKFNYKSLKASP